MRVVVDSNVILDVLQNRQPFVSYSSKVLRLAETNRIMAYITANSITDIYYILRRFLRDKEKLYTSMETLLQLIRIINVTAEDVRSAFHPYVVNFEGELISVCAEREKMDYIITRNTKDFLESSVQAIAPEDFLRIL